MDKYNEVPANDTIDEIYRRNDVHAEDIYALKHLNPTGVWIKATLENAWAVAGGTYSDVYYRIVHNDTLEFKGHVKNGLTGTTVFTLIRPYWPLTDKSFITDIDSGGGVFSAARVLVSSVDGTVKIYFPIVP